MNNTTSPGEGDYSPFFGTYLAPKYREPFMVRATHLFFGKARFLHSDDFSNVLSHDKDDQKEYAYGIIFFCSILLCLAILWYIILVILKLKGRSVGCAAGLPFMTSKNQCIQPVVDERSESGSTRSLQEINSVTSSIDSRELMLSNHVSSRYEQMRAPIITVSREERRRNRLRAKRCRMAFLVFAITSITVSCLSFVFAFAPIKQSMIDVDEQLDNVLSVVYEVRTSIRTIESASDYAAHMINKTNLKVEEVCPNATNQTDVLGVDVHDMISTMMNEYESMQNIVERNITVLTDVVGRIENAVAQSEDIMNKANSYLWIVPGFLVAVAGISTISLLAVLLAWKRRSGEQFQIVMAYGVLPCLVAVSVACWIGAIIAASGTMISGDACVGQGGSPDDNIRALLQMHSIDVNSSTYQYVDAYTNGCSTDSRDPTEDLSKLEAELHSTITNLWRHISTVDSIGRDNLADECGVENINDQVAAARALAKSLTSIRNAVDSTISTIACPRIHTIYVQLIHEGLCGKAADGISWGFCLVQLLVVCTMVLVSLRSSWYHFVEEEKVYNEDEVAHNMILNEHEDYLEYISKFKHEWEEYNGLDPIALHGDSDGFSSGMGSDMATSRMGDANSSSAGSLYLEEVEFDEESFVTEDESTVSYAHDQQQIYDAPSHSSQSEIPDDLSFPSLQMPRSESFEDGDDPMNVPSVLGVRPLDLEDEERDVLELQRERGYSCNDFRDAPILGEILITSKVPTSPRPFDSDQSIDVREEHELFRINSDHYEDQEIVLIDSFDNEDVTSVLAGKNSYVLYNGGGTPRSTRSSKSTDEILLELKSSESTLAESRDDNGYSKNIFARRSRARSPATPRMFAASPVSFRDDLSSSRDDRKPRARSRRSPSPASSGLTAVSPKSFRSRRSQSPASATRKIGPTSPISFGDDHSSYFGRSRRSPSPASARKLSGSSPVFFKEDDKSQRSSLSRNSAEGLKVERLVELYNSNDF